MSDVIKAQVKDLKEGKLVIIDDEPCKITSIQKSKPGKHGSAKARVEGMSLLTGHKKSLLKGTDGDCDIPILLRKNAQVVADMGENRVQLMDLETYEQIALKADQTGDAKNFLIDNLEVDILLFGDRPIGITLPNFVDLTVTQADPWVKGDSVSGDSKPVTLETGYVLRVPPFIEEGTKITLDTRTGEYVTRVKE